jgi:hypothetical protein
MEFVHSVPASPTQADVLLAERQDEEFAGLAKQRQQRLDLKVVPDHQLFMKRQRQSEEAALLGRKKCGQSRTHVLPKGYLVQEFSGTVQPSFRIGNALPVGDQLLFRGPNLVLPTNLIFLSGPPGRALK